NHVPSFSPAVVPPEGLMTHSSSRRKLELCPRSI
ncbi:unnamed protein product, partial [Allacma fusca]